MHKLPTYVGNFNNLNEVELVLNTLVSKFNRKLVTEIKHYKRDISVKTGTIMISKINIFTSGSYKTAMPFKEFKRKFICKSISFKTIL